MRKINRQPQQPEFTHWVNHNTRAIWEDFSVNAHDLYLQCRDCLEQDQAGVSGYTEKPLQKKHIDHFKTRNLFPNDTFNWYNYVVDEREEDRFGSGIKDRIVTRQDYENNLIINPIVEDPHDFFTYDMKGKIIARIGLNDVDKKRATRTIELFNLNDDILVNCRMNIIRSFDYLSQDYTINEMESACKDMGFYSLYDFYRENEDAFQVQI